MVRRISAEYPLLPGKRTRRFLRNKGRKFQHNSRHDCIGKVSFSFFPFARVVFMASSVLFSDAFEAKTIRRPRLPQENKSHSHSRIDLLGEPFCPFVRSPSMASGAFFRPLNPPGSERESGPRRRRIRFGPTFRLFASFFDICLQLLRSFFRSLFEGTTRPPARNNKYKSKLRGRNDRLGAVFFPISPAGWEF